MSENPLQLLLKIYDTVSNSIQTQLAQFIGYNNNDHQSSSKNQPTSTRLLQHSEFPKQEKSAGPVTKEELGRATWTFLHTLGAQMEILSRMYPCNECADHFKEVLSYLVYEANPVQAGSQAEFSQWLCHVHNVVNRSLSKPKFPCDQVDARWGKLDCGQRACDLQGADRLWFRYIFILL
ncbi:unnamed protein product [Withania somnifera]